MKQRTLKKRILCFLISIVLFMPTLMGLFSYDIKADSKSLSSTYINLMSSAKITEIEDIDKLTQNDLKVISLFLSNFYSPFNTALDSDLKSYNLGICVDALTTIGVDQDAAKTLVSTAMNSSLSYMHPLFYKADVVSALNLSSYLDINKGTPYLDKDTYANEAYRKYTNCTNTLTLSPDYAPLTVFSFWALYSKLCSSLAIDNTALETINFYMARDNIGVDTSTPVFKFNHSFCVYFGNLIESMKASSSTGFLGNAMINTSADEITSLKMNDFANLICFTQPMYVDWVGNIIADVGDRRVIVVPAVMNPCAFVSMQSNETIKLYGDGSIDGGESLTYLVSTFGIKLLQNTIIPDKYIYNNKGNTDFFKTTRGSTTKATWDNSSKWFSGGDMEHYKKNIKELDVNVPVTNTNKWDANTMYLTIPNQNKCKFFDSDNLVCLGVTFDSFTNMNEDGTKAMSLVNYDETSKEYSSEYLTLSHSYFPTTDAYSCNEDFEAVLTISSDDKLVLSTIFLTYVYLYKNGVSATGVTYSDVENKIPIRYMSTIFPQAEGTLSLSTTGTTEDEVTSFIYYLLHPTKGAEYFVNWVKNKVSALFVGWHEDMVGGTDSNVTTGITKYIGFSGYVTIPNLEDIEFLDWLMHNYDIIIIYLILIISAILVCYVLVGQLTIYRALLGAFMFGLLAFLPPRVMSLAINTINVTCNSIYSNKFDYWAITQNQAYLPILNNQITTLSNPDGNVLVSTTVREGSSVSDYSYSNTSDAYTLVKVKWESPKRMNDIYKLEKDLNNLNKDNTFSGSFINMVTNAVGNNELSETMGDSNSFVYRSYMDLYTYSSMLYNIYTCDGKGKITTGGFGYPYLDGSNSLILSSNDTEISDDSIKNVLDSYTIQNILSGNPENTIETGPNVKAKYDSGKYLDSFLRTNIQNTGVIGVDDTSSLKAIERGFLYSSVEANSGSYYGYKTLATSSLVRFSDKIVNPALVAFMNIYKTTLGDGLVLKLNELKQDGNLGLYYGIPTEKFQFTTTDILVGNFDKSADVSKEFNGTSDRLGAKDKLPYTYYSCYTESPYYFFNFNIRDQLIKKGYEYKSYDFGTTIVNNNTNGHGMETYNAGKLVSMLLEDNSSYFHNTGISAANDGYGQLRDFMNLHDLFYYIIPILNQGNKTVDLFDGIYKMETFDDCTYEITSGGGIIYNNKNYPNNKAVWEDIKVSDFTSEETYKLWHDMNVYTLFNFYTDWVRTMYDCDYAKGETITVAGEKFYVENPLDPTCYFALDDTGNISEGRYMVFSRSEMAYYGLSEYDLTEVERRCIEVQDNVYKNTLKLMNYNTFNDEVLIQAYSMIQLFEFNKVFSQKSVFSEDYLLYPQNFELKAFSLDAYLRLILSEASGESLMANAQDGSNKSIYTRVLENTSLFFGIVLLINDVICIYVLPAIRFIFLVVVFFMSVAMIVAGAIKLYDDTGLSLMQTCINSLIKPLISFIAISVGLAFVISLFMYNGPTAVTKQGNMTISFNEPTITVLFVTIINITAIVLYWKILKTCFKDLVKFIKAISASISGAVSGAMGTLAKTAMGLGAYRVLSGKGGFGGADNQTSSASSNTSNDAAVRGRNNSSPLGALAGAAVASKGVGSLSGMVSGGVTGQEPMTTTEAYNKGAEKYNSATARSEAGAKAELKNEQLKAEQRQDARDTTRQSRIDKANDAKKKAEDIKRDHEAAKGVFKNKNAGLINRAHAGVDAVKTGVSSKMQNLKAGAETAKANVANGVGSRLDGLVDKLNGNNYKMQKAQIKVDNAKNERQAKLATMKKDAITRNENRYATDRANKNSYHAKTQHSGSKSSTYSNNNSSVVRNAARNATETVLKNRAAQSGIVLPY